MKKTVFCKITSLILVILMVMSTMMASFTVFAVEPDLTIGTPEELLAFKQEIANGNTFSGKLIHLTADIDMSGVENWPTGNQKFHGTFDGNGHSITKLSATATMNEAGLLFGMLGNATVQNLVLKNCSYTGSKNCMGLIAGNAQDGAAVLKNLYVDGMVTQYWGADSAILLGRIEKWSAATSVTIENCVVNGDLTGSSADFASGNAGFVGRVKNASLTMKNCAFLGAVTTSSSNGQVAAFHGVNENSAVSLTNCINMGFLVSGPGTLSTQDTSCGVIAVTSENFAEILAACGSAWKQTDRVEMMPATVADMIGKIYDPSGSTDDSVLYTIGTPEELVAFAEEINGGNQFEGITVKLTADLDMTGVAWTCIGRAQVFSGIFDGCGYSISNLTGAAYENEQGLLFSRLDGATVQNLRMLGGSFSGRLAGGVIASNTNGRKQSVLKNIYVDTAVESDIQDNTGLLGRACFDTIIQDCVVASTINGKGVTNWGAFAGIVGRIKAEPISPNVLISDCLFTGTISCNHEKARVAPILGLFESGNYEIKNCFNTGTMTIEKGTYGSDDTMVDTIDPETFDFTNFTAMESNWVQTGEKEMMPASVAQMLGKSYTPGESTPNYITPGKPIYSYECKDSLADISSSRVLLDTYVNGAVDSWDLEKSCEIARENDVSIKNELPVPQTHVTFEFNVENAGTYNIAIEYCVTNEEMFQYVMQFAINELGKDTFYLQYADGRAWVVVTQALEAGKHTFTVYAPDNCFKTLEGGKMIRSCNVRNFKVYQNISASGLTVLEGAAIRMDAEASELRYTVRVDKAIYESLVSAYGAKNVTIGVVFANASDAAKLGILTKEAFNREAYKYYDYNKPQLLEDEEGYYFYGYWKPDSADGYDDMMSAAGYIRYKAEDGKSKYIYTSYNPENDRSIALVATRAAADIKTVSESGYENAVTVNGATAYSPYTAAGYANLVALAAYYQEGRA